MEVYIGYLDLVRFRASDVLELEGALLCAEGWAWPCTVAVRWSDREATRFRVTGLAAQDQTWVYHVSCADTDGVEAAVRHFRRHPQRSGPPFRAVSYEATVGPPP